MSYPAMARPALALRSPPPPAPFRTNNPQKGKRKRKRKKGKAFVTDLGWLIALRTASSNSTGPGMSTVGLTFAFDIFSGRVISGCLTSAVGAGEVECNGAVDVVLR